MDWNMVGAISTGATGLIILVSALFVWWQLKEIRRSRSLTAYMKTWQFLQREDVREARDILINASNKKFENWSQEEIAAAEKVCYTYNAAAEIVLEGLIKRDFIVEKRRYSIMECWEAAKPMVIEYRKRRGEDFWRDFETLYKMAKRNRTQKST